jgi:hypothetical protein
MQNGILCLALISLMVFVARICRSVDLSQGASENDAHATGLSKRILSKGEARPEPRWERRFRTTVHATAKILGAKEVETPCHIVNISSSGMRIKWSATLPAVCQIQVRWGDHFFIGSMRHQSLNSGNRVIGLKLNTCNYTRIPWQWRIAFFGSRSGTAQAARQHARPESITGCEQFLFESLEARRLDQQRIHATCAAAPGINTQQRA